MRLTNFCDYSLISKNHLVKVVHTLSKLGYIHSSQGKGGGITLALKPEDINMGEIIEKIEPDFNLVECFSEARNACCISLACRLKGYFLQANRAFLDSLRKYSLADILKSKERLSPLIIDEKKNQTINMQSP